MPTPIHTSPTGGSPALHPENSYKSVINKYREALELVYVTTQIVQVNHKSHK